MGFMNQIKTVFLVSLLMGLLVYIGYYFGNLTGALFFGSFGLLFQWISFYYSDKIVLKMYNASEIKSGKVVNIVRRLAQRFDLPMPKVYVANLPIANAFATGRDPKHAAVCVTSGILNLLNDDELEGVLGHELSHIKHRDTLISAVATSIATLISYAAFFARFLIFTNRDNDENIFEIILFILLAPILATLIQLAISRTREYLADETSAKITHKPLALANALRKLEDSVKIRASNAYMTTENIFIVNPFKPSFLLSLFSTHPSTEDRINKLTQIAQEL